MSDIKGMVEHKKNLIESIILPLKYPNLFPLNEGSQYHRNVILYGPPGVGKQMLVKAVAGEWDECKFYYLDFNDQLCETSSIALAAREILLASARKEPAITVLGHLNAVFDPSEENKEKKEVLRELVWLIQEFCKDRSHMVVVATANEPIISGQYMPRFGRRFYIKLPDLETRQQLLEAEIQRRSHSLSETDLDEISVRMDGLIADDIHTLCQIAIRVPILQARAHTHFMKTTRACDSETKATWYKPCEPDEPGAQLITGKDILAYMLYIRPLILDDFKSALLQMTPSVDQTNIDAFTAFDSMHTQDLKDSKSTIRKQGACSLQLLCIETVHYRINLRLWAMEQEIRKAEMCRQLEETVDPEAINTEDDNVHKETDQIQTDSNDDQNNDMMKISDENACPECTGNAHVSTEQDQNTILSGENNVQHASCRCALSDSREQGMDPEVSGRIETIDSSLETQESDVDILPSEDRNEIVDASTVSSQIEASETSEVDNTSESEGTPDSHVLGATSGAHVTVSEQFLKKCCDMQRPRTDTLQQRQTVVDAMDSLPLPRVLRIKLMKLYRWN